MNKVENAARATASALAFKWDDLDETMKRVFLRYSFVTYEQTRDNLISGLDFAADVLREMIEDPSTPKNQLRGLTEGLQAVIDEIDELETASLEDLEDTIPERLADDDPYEFLMAEMSDPDAHIIGERCGAEHVRGWMCTRLAHPPHWNCWDSDPSITNSDIPDCIHAVWDARGVLLSWRAAATVDEDDD